MITKQNLKEIAIRKLSDAKLLSKSNRNDSSLYLIGYSVELALKFKICKILKLDKGFPETKSEFDSYIKLNDNDLGNEIKDLREIRNHNLQKLLYYSGQEFSIKAELLEEWTNILYWNPELRYNLEIGDKSFNELIIKSVEKILTLIFK
jgi:HEPN domain-containing protein